MSKITPDSFPEDIEKMVEALFAQYNYQYDGPTEIEVAQLILAERERIAKRIEETYRNEEGEALRATFETKDGPLQAWHQASDVADFVRYNPQPD